MDKITRATIEDLHKEHPNASIHVWSEFMSPRRITSKNNHPICGVQPKTWDGSIIWIAWPGIHCAIEESGNDKYIGPM